MESHEDIDQEKGMNEALGGVRTIPFILANEGFEKAAYYGLLPNMLLYLMGVYGLDTVTGSNIIFLWSAATNFTPIVGAFLADAYVGRFRMISFGCVSALLGMIIMWSTTIIPGVTPPSHKETSSNSTSATLIQLVYICTSLGLMSIGSGGIRSSSMAFGADQLLSKGKPGGKRFIETFVSWYYFCSISAMVFAFTFIVYMQDHFGWQIGFAIPASLMFVSALCFFSASSFYVKMKPMSSAFTRLSQVVAASWRNRHYQFSSCLGADTIYHVAKGSILQVPTQKLRFLNKACIVKDRQRDISIDGIANDPWSLCTIDQVEDFKEIVNIIPIWSTGIMLAVTHSCVSSFLVVQAKSMDRHFITPSFEIPCASFGTFALSSVLLWIVLYDRVFIPLASRVMGKPVAIHVITRMGIGFVLSFACMVVAGVVENARRRSAIEGKLVMPMSALWLVPQVCLIGLAEGITTIAQIEFFYSKFPKSMASISVNLAALAISISGLVSSIIVSVINYVTKQDGAESWISSDPSKGHYDYFYWVLAGLSLLNFIYFLVCSRSYRK
ncbi:protein NRT1/ PTR FAMILY 1.1-like [Silene latifolia]|uniref:protein NRT1/ PTR FAMILY 1.1-like n=1 Tax=Silene latifolia TaxID=37657 RepID=UPI003D77B0F1